MLSKIMQGDNMLSWFAGEWITACDFKFGRLDEWMALGFIIQNTCRLGHWIADHSHYALWDALGSLWALPIVVFLSYRIKTKRGGVKC